MIPKFIQRKAVETAASKISKEDLLSQLETEWTKILSKNPNFDIEIETKRSMSRIQSTVVKYAFQRVGITEDDIRSILIRIKNNAQ